MGLQNSCSSGHESDLDLLCEPDQSCQQFSDRSKVGGKATLGRKQSSGLRGLWQATSRQAAATTDLLHLESVGASRCLWLLLFLSVVAFTAIYLPDLRARAYGLADREDSESPRFSRQVTNVVMKRS